MASHATGWTTRDKIAGIIALGLMSGYYISAIGTTVATTAHLVLAPLATLLPFSLFLLVLAGTTGFYSSIVGFWLRDNEQLEDVQQRMKAIQEQLKHAREQNDDDELSSLGSEQQDILKDWIRMMKLQFRPAVWSMLITVPIFLWIRWVMISPTVAIAPVAFFLPLVGHIVWTATLIGPLKVWMIWYLGGSLFSTLISQRVLKYTHQ